MGDGDGAEKVDPFVLCKALQEALTGCANNGGWM